MNMTFTKMQGLGNDFVVIDAVNQAVTLSAEQVRQIGDRHYGVGCDSVLLIETAKDSAADFAYRIFNADGSEVAQCGNGARCVAQFLWQTKLATAKTIALATAERIITVQPATDGQVSVNMGVPLLTPDEIPFIAPPVVKGWYPIELADQTVSVGVVNVGNPHAVLLVDDIDQARVEQIGAELEQHPSFPQRVNVGFMQVLQRDHIRLRVFERGVGETLACGSGACAAVVIGHVQGLLAEAVKVDLLGGRLDISWVGGPLAPIWLTGPAETVFTGEWLIRSC